MKKGDTPGRVRKLPYGRQTVDEDDIAAVVEVLESDWLTTGPKVEEFEQAFSKRVGASETRRILVCRRREHQGPRIYSKTTWF